MAAASEKPRVVLLVGLPGCGKSTWACAKKGVLSSDALRELLIDDAENQTMHALVFRVLRDLLKRRLELRRPLTFIDATNLTPRVRAPYMKIAAAFGADAEAVFFDVPTEVCIERNLGRSRKVPADVIREMAAKLVPPTLAEGFSRVDVVR